MNNKNRNNNSFNPRDYDMHYTYQIPNDSTTYGYFIDYDHLYQAMLEVAVEQSNNEDAVGMLENIGIRCK